MLKFAVNYTIKDGYYNESSFDHYITTCFPFFFNVTALSLEPISYNIKKYGHERIDAFSVCVCMAKFVVLEISEPLNKGSNMYIFGLLSFKIFYLGF